MRFIQILLMAMLVLAPVAENSFARGQDGGRTVAAEKSKKAKVKKAKIGKKAKATRSAKAKKKAVKKSVKKNAKAKKSKKATAKKAKKTAKAKKSKSHAPAELFPEDAADPAENFEISPEMQDDLPEPNTGSLTD